MKFSTLKRTHPTKYVFKVFCTIIFYLGGTNAWYTKKKMSKPVQTCYNVWVVVGNMYGYLGFLNQVLASFRPLTIKEKNDVVQFDIAHTTILAKITVFYLQKKRITALLREFLEEDREFSSLEVERLAVKRALRYCIAMQVTVFATLLFALLDGVIMHYKEGIPVRAEVVYYPSSEDSGVFVNILRVLVELHWYYIIAMMTCIDSISVCSLVFLAYKYRYLVTYFEDLKVKLQYNIVKIGVKNALQQQRVDFVNGIKLHEHALSFAKQIQHALGNLYSIQVVETMFLLIMALVKLVVIERNLMFLIASMMYMTCCMVLLGGYMMAAGDITHEASLLPNAIFSSGWEMTRGDKQLRTVTVVALIRSQRPVIMTAFGILELSYSNLIMVLKSSYSFFAVMY